MNLAQLAFTGRAMTAQMAGMPREPQDLTAREIDQTVALFRDGLNRKADCGADVKKS